MRSSRRFGGGTRGERRGLKKGSGLEFVDHRPYAPGDDLRSLDVGVYERHRRLFVRQYEEQEDLSLYLVVDASGSMVSPSGQKFRMARRLAAGLGYLGLLGLDRVTALSVSGGRLERSPALRGKARALTLLRFLEGLRAQGALGLGQGLDTFVRTTPRRGVVLLFTDGYQTAEVDEALRLLLGAGHAPSLVQIADDEYLRHFPVGESEILDVETGLERTIVMTEGLRRELVARQDAQRLALTRIARARGVPSEVIDVATPLQRALGHLLRAGGALR